MENIPDPLRQEPALAWKVTVNLLGADESSAEAMQARQAVWESPLVRQLVATCNRRKGVYKKWDGAHWLLASLADLGCPERLDDLRPLMDETFATWLSPEHEKQYHFIAEGRPRRHASQEGNALFSSLRLGFADQRADRLVEILLANRWPDCGWNCDRDPAADTSSFHETLTPLRGLALYACLRNDSTVRRAVEQAAEIFLCRSLYMRLRTGNVIHHSFVEFHYPPYWHYDVLFGLKVMAEAGLLSDPRCRPALDLLESKRLSDGGYPAEATYSRRTNPSATGYSSISWGGTSTVHLNPFITADALYILRMAGRWQPTVLSAVAES